MKKNQMRRLSAAAIGWAMVSALAGCGAGGSDDTAEWDYFIFVPMTHPSGVAAQDFADAVEEATGGEVKITVRPAGELPLQAPEALQAVRSGEVEIADAYAGFVSGDVKTSGLLGLPFLATTNEEGTEAVDAISEDIAADLDEYGAELLFKYDWNMQILAGTGDAVTQPDDLDGHKTRSSSPQQSAWLDSMGAFPTTLPTSEVPTALSTGVIDSVLTTPLNITGSGWGDLFDWVYTLGVNPGISFIVVGQEALSEVSQESQQAIREVADEFNTKISERLEQENEASLAELEQLGVTVTDATPEQIAELREQVGGYWDEWAEQNDSVETLSKITSALGL